MSTTSLVEITGTQFSAGAEVTDDQRIVMRLTGSADGASKPDFDRVIDTIKAEAAKRKAREVDIDLRTLEFMDSSCIKSFVSWISALQDMDELNRYHLHFVCDPAAHWQKRSMHALSLFGEDLVLVDF